MSGSESLAKSTGNPNKTSHGSTELWDVFLLKYLTRCTTSDRVKVLHQMK